MSYSVEKSGEILKTGYLLPLRFEYYCPHCNTKHIFHREFLEKRFKLGCNKCRGESFIPEMQDYHTGFGGDISLGAKIIREKLSDSLTNHEKRILFKLSNKLNDLLKEQAKVEKGGVKQP